ncbi:ESX-1 secretion-associated protein [Saccharopolyspora indica]|uniref:type VII secretion target n=1 Tax=Saccharopolyspora indica TaxID=1229659 RepID=UPI0022EB2D77|nr:type VII secretion target [Saccharopolyspora indica]MDA3643161.1 type VII secretion target [Saccharopolyspora indica]
MNEKFKVEPDELRGYAEMLDRNAQHFLDIREFAAAKGADTSGFTGVLTLLQPVVTAVGRLYGETLEFANKRLTGVSDALNESVDLYEEDDRANSERIKQVESVMNEAAGLGGSR